MQEIFQPGAAGGVQEGHEGRSVVVREENPGADFPEVKKGGLDRLIRVYGYVMAAVYKWRKRTGAMGPVIINGTQLPNGKVLGYPSIECLRAAELYLLEKAQKDLKAAKMKSLTRLQFPRKMSMESRGSSW
jgi:hypothetical protein